MMSLGMNNLSSLSSSYTFSRYRAMEPFHDSCTMDYDEIVQEGGGREGRGVRLLRFPRKLSQIFLFFTCPTVL